VIREREVGRVRALLAQEDPKLGRRRNLGTFKTLAAAKHHDRAVHYFKRH
jgi:hypothetical protein